MTKAEFLVRQVTDRINFIVLQNEKTIRPQQVVCQQKCIVGCHERLMFALEQ